MEITILCIIAAFVVGLLLNLKKQDAAAQTLEEKWFANCFEPQFYEQRDPTEAAAQSARAEWENARKMLLECGNRFIQETDLHLWLWRASGNEKVSFAGWQAQCEADRQKIKERWIAEKSANLKMAPEEMARVVWGEHEESEKLN